MAKNTMDPWSKDFDFDEYKRRWRLAIKQPVVTIAIIGCAIGILLAFSTFVFPDWSFKIRTRAIIAFIMCFSCAEVAKQNIQNYIQGGTLEDQMKARDERYKK